MIFTGLLFFVAFFSPWFDTTSPAQSVCHGASYLSRKVAGKKGALAEYSAQALSYTTQLCARGEYLDVRDVNPKTVQWPWSVWESISAKSKSKPLAGTDILSAVSWIFVVFSTLLPFFFDDWCLVSFSYFTFCVYMFSSPCALDHLGIGYWIAASGAAIQLTRRLVGRLVG
jgi:hypothetical protein